MGDIVLTGAAVVGVAGVAAGMAIVNLLRTPTEEKLRRLTPPERWGERIGSQSCPHCQASMEAPASYCYGCGLRLSSC